MRSQPRYYRGFVEFYRMLVLSIIGLWTIACLFIWLVTICSCIPTFKFEMPASRSEMYRMREPTKDEFKQSCAICLVDFSDGSEVVDLPCKHVFHGRCLEQWADH